MTLTDEVGAGCRVGDAVRAWCLETHSSRRDVFVTTKIIAPSKTQEETLASLRESVNKINLDGKLSIRHITSEPQRGVLMFPSRDCAGYVDCFLIHTPTSGPEGRKHLWEALKELRSEGKVITIGVSN